MGRAAPADGSGRCKKPDDRLERNPVRYLAVVTSLLVAWLGPSSANAQRVVAETFMIPAVDPGIQLHVRNKRLEGRDSFPGERVVLFVHGATYPSETVFDIDLPGGSWAEHVARKGYDIYLVDVRGYGRSTRPAAMDAPPAENPPSRRLPTRSRMSARPSISSSSAAGFRNSTWWAGHGEQRSW